MIECNGLQILKIAEQISVGSLELNLGRLGADIKGIFLDISEDIGIALTARDHIVVIIKITVKEGMRLDDGMLDGGIIFCCRTCSAGKLLHTAGKLNLIAGRSENSCARIGYVVGSVEGADRADMVACHGDSRCRRTLAKLVVRIHIGKGETVVIGKGTDGNIVGAGSDHALTGLRNQRNARTHAVYIDQAHCLIVGIEREGAADSHGRALTATDVDLLDRKSVRNRNFYKTYTVVKSGFFRCAGDLGHTDKCIGIRAAGSSHLDFRDGVGHD